MKNETKNELRHRLVIQTGAHFNSCHEWCIVDFIYWKSNTQPDRRWICRMKPIMETTPVKRIETITDALDRLCEREMGFSKVPFGTPQRRRKGKGLTDDAIQSFQYVFDANVFDKWLAGQPKRPIRKRIDPYPKADSTLSGTGQHTYPKADTKRMNKKEEKNDLQEPEIISVIQSQPPARRVAPVYPDGMDLAAEFDRICKEVNL
jgi:hypothetical protein